MNRRISRKLAALPTEPGPKTESAKSNVKHNAYTHGLTAQALLLSAEEQPVYDAMVEDFRRRFQPADGFEQQLLQKIIDTNWRLNISASVESALYAMVPYNAFANPNATPAETYLKDRARVFVDKANAFGLLGRYEAGLDRRFRNMLAELEAAIAQRQAATPFPAPQPTIGAGHGQLNSSLKELVMSATASSQPQQNASLNAKQALFRKSATSTVTTSAPASATPLDRVRNAREIEVRDNDGR